MSMEMLEKGVAARRTADEVAPFEIEAARVGWERAQEHFDEAAGTISEVISHPQLDPKKIFTYVWDRFTLGYDVGEEGGRTDISFSSWTKVEPDARASQAAKFLAGKSNEIDPDELQAISFSKVRTPMIEGHETHYSSNFPIRSFYIALAVRGGPVKQPKPQLFIQAPELMEGIVGPDRFAEMIDEMRPEKYRFNHGDNSDGAAIRNRANALQYLINNSRSTSIELGSEINTPVTDLSVKKARDLVASVLLESVGEKVEVPEPPTQKRRRFRRKK